MGKVYYKVLRERVFRVTLSLSQRIVQPKVNQLHQLKHASR